MYVSRVSGAVNRSAWVISPEATSSQRTSPGRIGRPAASALVQPSGRRSFEDRSQIAPEPACQVPLADWRAANSSYSLQPSRSTRSMWASEPSSISGKAGIGYGPASDSSS